MRLVAFYLMPMFVAITVFLTLAIAEQKNDPRLQALGERFSKLYTAEEWIAAEPLGVELLQALERDDATAPATYAVTVWMMAKVYEEQGTPEKSALADTFYDRALVLYRRLTPPNLKSRAQIAHKYALFKLLAGDYPRALKLMDEALSTALDGYGPWHDSYATILKNAAALQLMAGDHHRAIELSQQAIEILSHNKSDIFGDVNNLGIAYQLSGELVEAETTHRRALTILEGTGRQRTADYALTLGRLASIFGEMQDFEQSEQFLLRALVMHKQIHGADSSDYAAALESLAEFYDRRSQYEPAKRYYLEAIRIRRLRPDTHLPLANALDSLGQVYSAAHEYERALPMLEEAVAVCRETPSEVYHDCMLDLAVLQLRLGDREKGEPLLKRALELKSRQRGGEHVNYGADLGRIADLFCELDDPARAIPLYEHAIEIEDRSGIHPVERFKLYARHARAEWRLDHRAAAVQALERALDLVEGQRGKLAGNDEDRGRFLGSFQNIFEQMLSWRLELNQLGEAFSVHERGRARSLVDQMQIQGVDLMATVEPMVAADLRRREAAATAEIAIVERELKTRTSTDDNQTKQSADRLDMESRLAAAREKLVGVHREIRNASPAYRLAVSHDYRPLDLAKLDQWIADNHGLLLEYAIGDESSTMFVVSGDGAPRAEPLVLSDVRAKQLGIKAGPLTSGVLDALWRVNDQDLIVLLSNPRSADAANDRLALLYEILIPESVRPLLRGENYRTLYIVPDGRLATLPFETLVVEPGSRPKRLIDDGPPILYAPSSSILVNLSQRRGATQIAYHSDESVQPVLTIGDPVYDGNQPVADSNALLTARSRYSLGAGDLQPLPYTAIESKWVAEVFQQSRIPVAALRGPLATEDNVRGNVAHREIVHFACHGLIDQKFGNFFGALALTPGNAQPLPMNDGFLTLAEIYALPLAGCELAILSACQTNAGPQQRGEGLYGLSRGFLVAGSRRVVASNWLVDDEAAASLISYFCGVIAKAEQAGERVDYAAALSKAKRWVRRQEKWCSPYYWGTFVLVGPS